MNVKLRVIFITQGVSRIVDPLLESRHEIVGVIESAPRNYKNSKKWVEIKNIIKWLNYKFFINKSVLKLVCQDFNTPYRFMTSSDDKGLESWIREKKPDVIVVFSMSQLLKRKIFSIPESGTINLHPSFLPEHRGPNPDVWQYIDMEEYPGATVHYIDEGEDTGDIIVQDRIHIPLGTKSPDRLDQLVGKLGVSLIFEALDAIETGKAPRVAQPSGNLTPRARNLRLDEHNAIIDWESWPVERVWHVLRGTESWLNALPQPVGILKGQRWTVEHFDKKIRDTDTPGKIYKIGNKTYAAAQDGRVFLTINFNMKRLILGFIKYA